MGFFSPFDYPENGSWTRPSVRLAGRLTRREEDAGAAPATSVANEPTQAGGPPVVQSGV